MLFAVSAFFEGVHTPTKSSENLWEDVIYLVESETELNALEEAKKIAEKHEHSYGVEGGGNLAWKFRDLGGIREIDGKEFHTGTELFSRFISASEAASLLKKIDLKDNKNK